MKREGENDRRIVSQFQYTGWPDHGIPDDIDVILTMIAKMREIRSRDKSFDPVVVHCRFSIIKNRLTVKHVNTIRIGIVLIFYALWGTASERIN